MEIERGVGPEWSRAHAQLLMDQGRWAFNADGFQHWSSELFEIHGLQQLGRAPNIPEYLALVHPEDREFVANEIKTMLANNSSFDFTKRIVRPDGTVRYVRCIGSPAAAGGVFVGTGMDVTDQEDLTALRKSEKALRRLVDGISAFVTAHTPEGELEFANRQVLDYSGKTFEELKEWANNDAIHPDDLGKVLAEWTDSLRTGLPYEHVNRYRRFDGLYRWFRAHGLPSRDSEGRILRWYVVLNDVDESQRAKDTIEEQQRELQQVLDFAPQLVAVLGPRFERIYVNRPALEYLGYELDEWIDSAEFSQVHPDDRQRLDVFARALPTDRASEIEVRIPKSDGSHRWFLARYNPVCDDAGKLLRWYVACTDIDERRKSEERLKHENSALREEIEKTSMFEEIVGVSPALREVLSRVAKVAASDSTVLITGETGTGKELVARAIHRRSNRNNGAFIAVNCAAIPRELIASELFGHEKGAFTGATHRRIGRFELADGGTILLDEVGELWPENQAALLRLLQEQEFERIGGHDPIRVNVRVIAATNRDLEAAVADGAFRRDLFYRLQVFPVEMPPLRMRAEDIPLLVRYFIKRYALKMGKTFRDVDKHTLERLQSYAWPGNVRELQNVIERSVIVCDTADFKIDSSWLSSPSIDKQSAMFSSLAAHEKSMIEDALRACRGRVFGPLGAAARLGLPRSTLESKIRVLKIDKRRFRRQSSP